MTSKKQSADAAAEELAQELRAIDAPAVSPPERAGAKLLMGMIDMLRINSRSWDQLSKGQQDSLILRMRQEIRVLIADMVRSLKAGAYQAAEVEIDSVTVKEGAKASISFGTQSAHKLIDFVGQRGVLVLCNLEQFMQGTEAVEGEDEQRPLPLEPEKEQSPTTLEAVKNGMIQVGSYVRHRGEENGPVRCVTLVTSDGRIEVEGLVGQFLASEFVVVQP